MAGGRRAAGRYDRAGAGGIGAGNGRRPRAVPAPDGGVTAATSWPAASACLFSRGPVGPFAPRTTMRAGSRPGAGEPEMLRPEQLEPPRGGCFPLAQVTLDLPVQPAAAARPHHNPVEDVFLGNLENVLEDAELRPVPGEHRHAGGDTLIGDRELLVVYMPTIANPAPDGATRTRRGCAPAPGVRRAVARPGVLPA